MGETPSEPSKSFTMDDYFEEPEREREGEAMSVQDPMYTEEQMLFWSADQ